MTREEYQQRVDAFINASDWHENVCDNSDDCERCLQLEEIEKGLVRDCPILLLVWQCFTSFASRPISFIREDFPFIYNARKSHVPLGGAENV